MQAGGHRAFASAALDVHRGEIVVVEPVHVLRRRFGKPLLDGTALAYFCYNRSVDLIGANRAAPFFHTVPVFGSAMAIFFLGKRLHCFICSATRWC
jgi:hypothetical protein